MKITDKHVFFYNGIYSQWYRSSFMIDGVKFSSCEQYMMYKKALLFGDENIANQIIETEVPAEQKALGKLVKGFDRTIWDQHCFSIVYQGNFAKFTQNPKLQEELLATGDRVLVEASPYDFIWGIKLGDESKDVDSPSLWRGLNLLGFAIMTVRNQIR